MQKCETPQTPSNPVWATLREGLTPGPRYWFGQQTVSSKRALLYLYPEKQRRTASRAVWNKHAGLAEHEEFSLTWFRASC